MRISEQRVRAQPQPLCRARHASASTAFKSLARQSHARSVTKSSSTRCKERELPFPPPPAPSYFEDHLFLTVRLPNFMCQACVIPYCSFENKLVFCDGPKRGSALRKKHRRTFFCPGVSLFWEGAQAGERGGWSG